MESARRSGPALQTSLGLGVGPQPPGEGHAESHAGRQRRTDGSAAAQVLGTLPLWVALGSCLAARGHVTGNGDTQTPPAHSPCSERTLTQAEARPCPPCLPGPLSPTKPHWVPLQDRLERTKYLSVHMPVVRIEKLARDQEWPDARILACSQNQAHGATLQGSERNEDRHDTDGSSWSCKTARA